MSMLKNHSLTFTLFPTENGFAPIADLENPGRRKRRYFNLNHFYVVIQSLLRLNENSEKLLRLNENSKIVIQSVSKKLMHYARKTTLFNTIYIKQWRLACKVHKFF